MKDKTEKMGKVDKPVTVRPYSVAMSAVFLAAAAVIIFVASTDETLLKCECELDQIECKCCDEEDCGCLADCGACEKCDKECDQKCEGKCPKEKCNVKKCESK